MRPGRRLLASFFAISLLLTAAPASAEDNLWKRWWTSIPLYEPKILLPLAVVATLPALVVATPIELIAMGYGATVDLFSSDDDADDAEGDADDDE